MKQENKSKEFNEKFLGSYQQEQSDPTNKNHHFDSEAVVNSEQVTKPATAKPAAAQELAASVTKPAVNLDLTAFGYPITDFTNALLPNGAPVGSRHKSAIKLAYDLLIICDGDVKKVLALMMQLQWVKDVVAERGQKEIDDIMDAAQKLKHKREGEQLNDLQPSKDMQRAIKQVTGRSYNVLLSELRKQAMAAGGEVSQDDIIKLLENIGSEIEKLFPRYPLLKLLCQRLPRKRYIAALLVGGAFMMTLMTRCWYRFWPAPGRQCRLNSLLALIGRPGSGKHMAVQLYEILMEPIRKADQVQIDALNRWNLEKDQNSGASKNKSPRPNGIYRALPSETSAAGAREAETNAKEMIDGKEWYLHVSQFDSELDNTLRQIKKSYMEALFTLWLKSFHSEPHGSLLKTSSAHVGEYPVHYNCVYTGTSDALNKMATEANFVNGLLSRFTFVPMGDSDYKMMEAHEYDEADAERDRQLSEWAYRLDACKGEVPCKIISDALYHWTARRMEDAKENDSKAEEDMIKRPCWHGINYVLPFVVSRHWDKMVEDGGRYKCGEDFQPDKYDVQLALLIAKAQLAFQEYYFKAIGEKHYDDQLSLESSGRTHQQKTWIGYRRLPNLFTSQDVDICFGYEGKTGSICSKLKRLVDDGLAQKITKGEDKGKYRKLM
jgi:hypothetical protein